MLENEIKFWVKKFEKKMKAIFKIPMFHKLYFAFTHLELKL